MNRRVVALAAALGGLLAVVAAASAVSAPASEGGGLGLPEWVVTYGYAALVLVALVGIPTLVLLGIRELPEARRTGKQRWLSPLVLAALVVVAVAISSRSDGRLSEILARLRVVEPTAAEAEAARPPEPAWLPVLVASAIAVGGVVVLGRRSRPRRQGLGDRLEAALALPLADLRDEPDVRRAIVRGLRAPGACARGRRRAARARRGAARVRRPRPRRARRPAGAARRARVRSSSRRSSASTRSTRTTARPRSRRSKPSREALR